mmetsp:Transcript_24172/g.70947  ORF Transcript_24172/g.70947 Transcript_24172/m.70947 type:complete len:242 (-) Transcript_24172:3-728(-)
MVALACSANLQPRLRQSAVVAPDSSEAIFHPHAVRIQVGARLVRCVTLGQFVMVQVDRLGVARQVSHDSVQQCLHHGCFVQVGEEHVVVLVSLEQGCFFPVLWNWFVLSGLHRSGEVFQLFQRDQSKNAVGAEIVVPMLVWSVEDFKQGPRYGYGVLSLRGHEVEARRHGCIDYAEIQPPLAFVLVNTLVAKAICDQSLLVLCLAHTKGDGAEDGEVHATIGLPDRAHPDARLTDQGADVA